MKRASQGNAQDWAKRIDARGASFPWDRPTSEPAAPLEQGREKSGGDSALRPWLVFASSALCVFSGGTTWDEVA